MNVLKSDTCVCGSVHWHEIIHANVVWCSKCGCARTIFSKKWYVPLDRSGDVSASVTIDEEEEEPTKPDRPIKPKP